MPLEVTVFKVGLNLGMLWDFINYLTAYILFSPSVQPERLLCSQNMVRSVQQGVLQYTAGQQPELSAALFQLLLDRFTHSNEYERGL